MLSMIHGFPLRHPAGGLLTAACHSFSIESPQHLFSFTCSQIINTTCLLQRITLCNVVLKRLDIAIMEIIIFAYGTLSPVQSWHHILIYLLIYQKDMLIYLSVNT